MEAKFKSFGVQVDAESDRLRVSVHACERDTTISASHYCKLDDSHENARKAYISVSVASKKQNYEMSEEEKSQGWCAGGSDTITYFNIDQARELHEKLSRALACADVK